MNRLLLIVEGQGEQGAAPVLARRVLHELHEKYEWVIPRPHRRWGIKQLQSNNWEKLKRFLSVAFKEEAPVLWMLDCDDGCAIEWMKEIYAALAGVPLKQPLAFALWIREYEAMFLYDFDCTKTQLDIRSDCEPLAEPDAKRGVKDWISNQMPKNRIYKETIHQEALTGRIDLPGLRDYRSFRHFEKALLWLTEQTQPALYPFEA